APAQVATAPACWRGCRCLDELARPNVLKASVGPDRVECSALRSAIVGHSAGNRVIKMHASRDDTVFTVSDNGKPSASGQPPLRMADDGGAASHRADLTGLASVMTAGDADGADAKF